MAHGMKDGVKPSKTGRRGHLNQVNYGRLVFAGSHIPRYILLFPAAPRGAVAGVLQKEVEEGVRPHLEAEAAGMPRHPGRQLQHPERQLQHLLPAVQFGRLVQPPIADTSGRMLGSHRTPRTDRCRNTACIGLHSRPPTSEC
jgi:hypothetical protein